MSDREVQLYCRQEGGKFIFPSEAAFSQELVPKTIDELTRAFLSRLDQENPGTANVVLRTIDKIDSVQLDEEKLKQQVSCKRCLLPAGKEMCYSCSKDLNEWIKCGVKLSMWFY